MSGIFVLASFFISLRADVRRAIDASILGGAYRYGNGHEECATFHEDLLLLVGDINLNAAILRNESFSGLGNLPASAIS